MVLGFVTNNIVLVDSDVVLYAGFIFLSRFLCVSLKEFEL